MGIRVGIDLGTTFSAIAMIDKQTGKPVIIKNSFNGSLTPSVLCFERNGNIMFGEDAKNMQLIGAENTVAFFKRSMGKDMFALDILGKTYNATDLSALLLKNLKREAEQQINEKIDAAVITVPAYFTHKEREATIAAGKSAGLNVISIINEPTAAAFAYGLNEKDDEQTVLIYDLGGGTFDVTIARINQTEVNVLGSDGNHELGGKDWDDCIARYLVNEFYEKYGIDLSEDEEKVTSLLVLAETVKKQLTSSGTVTVPINYKDIKGTVEITEETFQSISQFLIGTTRDVIDRLFDSLSMDWSNIDGVILVGGSTRMRMIHDYVRNMSGKEPLGGVDVDEAVALGAAIRANITEKGQTALTITGLFGRKKDAELMIQGAKAVTDVTAHSLGMIAISPDGERYINSIITKKNSKIPVANTRPYHFRTRTKDNELEIYVLQGEHDRPLDNTIINKYVVTEIAQTSAVSSVIQVTYEYTADGVIKVSALQEETGMQLPVRIEPVLEDMSWTDGSPKDVIEEVSAPLHVDVLLAIDLSGSMDGTPIREARRAMRKFVDELEHPLIKIGVIIFASKTIVKLKPTDKYEKIKLVIEELEIDGECGYGNGDQPFTTSNEILTASNADLKYIIVLTDGYWSHSKRAIAQAENCHVNGIEVMALGFGSADYKFLKRIASTEKFASFTELSNLSGSFSKIAQAIGGNTTSLTVK